MARKNGWAPCKGGGAASALLMFVISDYVDALEVAVRDDSEFRKVVDYLSDGDIYQAERHADAFYDQLVDEGLAHAALNWQRAWEEAVADARSEE